MFSIDVSSFVYRVIHAKHARLFNKYSMRVLEFLVDRPQLFCNYYGDYSKQADESPILAFLFLKMF